MDGWLRVLNVPRLVVLAMSPTLTERGISVSSDLPDGDRPYVEMVRCTSTQDPMWSEIRGEAPARIGSVVMADNPNVDAYRRALKSGAAVVHLDTDPDIVSDVVAARLRGDIIVPAGIVAAVAAGVDRTLLPNERVVLQRVEQGESVADIARRVGYSERHVRRLIRSCMVKAGTQDRQAAIELFQAELG